MRALAAALFATVLLAPSLTKAEQPVTFELALQPTTATVGDRLTLTITARHPAGARLDVADDALAFAPLELLRVHRPESKLIDDGAEETRFSYIVAAFTTGTLQVEPIEATASIGGQEVVERLAVPAVTVATVLAPGDTSPRDLKGPLAVPTGEGGRWLWAALMMAAFAALSIATVALVQLVVRWRPSTLDRAPSADAVARRELDDLARAGLLDEGAYAEYYRRLAATLRRYLSERFGVPATALTADELSARLSEAGADPWPARLAENVLRQGDAVQFARYQPARERAEADRSSACEIVELTVERELDSGGRRPGEART
jgi:hypothetical protein